MTQPVDYRNVRAFSQSSLKLLDFNPQVFYNQEYRWVMGEIERPQDDPTDAMVLGTIVDALLTQPAELDRQFIFVKEVPSGQLKQFIDTFYNLEQIAIEDGTVLDHGSTRLLAKEAYDEVGFKRDKFETVVARFESEGLVYYNALRNSSGKRIVLQEVKDKAKALVKMLEDDEYTGPIIKQKSVHPFDVAFIGDHIEVFDQLAIYWEEHGLKFKALLDKVVVNHTKKTVQPYDIKTTGSSDFGDAFGNYRYDLQGAFYTDALHHFMDQQGWKEYTIKAFVFIVAFTNEKGIGPQLWQMGTYDYYAGRYGMSRPKLKEVKGYQALVSDLLWHIKENRWKYPREVYLKNGLRELNYYVDAPVRS